MHLNQKKKSEKETLTPLYSLLNLCLLHLTFFFSFSLINKNPIDSRYCHHFQRRMSTEEEATMEALYQQLEQMTLELEQTKRRTRQREEGNKRLREKIQAVNQRIARKKEMIGDKKTLIRAAKEVNKSLEDAIETQTIFGQQLKQQRKETKETLDMRQKNHEEQKVQLNQLQEKLLKELDEVKEKAEKGLLAGLDPPEDQDCDNNNDVLEGVVGEEGVKISSPSDSKKKTDLDELESLTLAVGSDTESVFKKRDEDVDEELEGMAKDKAIGAQFMTLDQEMEEEDSSRRSSYNF